jgi:hypothetical protein
VAPTVELKHDGGTNLTFRRLARATGDANRAAERLDPVGEADEPRAARRIRSAYAVVSNRQQQSAVALLERDVDPRRV